MDGLSIALYGWALAQCAAGMEHCHDAAGIVRAMAL